MTAILKSNLSLIVYPPLWCKRRETRVSKMKPSGREDRDCESMGIRNNGKGIIGVNLESNDLNRQGGLTDKPQEQTGTGNTT